MSTCVLDKVDADATEVSKLFARFNGNLHHEILERMVGHVNLAVHDQMPCAVRNAAQALTRLEGTDVLCCPKKQVSWSA